MMKRLLFTLFTPLLLSAIPYELNFIGLSNETALKAIFDVSDLVLLQDHPPASVNALRYRIASDIPSMLKVLRAYGYYDATITSEVEQKRNEAEVSIYIQAGPQYTLSSYEVFHGDCAIPISIAGCEKWTPKNLGLQLGAPAIAVDIVNAELNLLTQLAGCGYPLATVEKRRVIVDMATKQVEAATCIHEGPLAKFGPVTIVGLTSVKIPYLMRRVAWEEGTVYNPGLIEETQKRLLNSNLFSSVLVTHGDQLDAVGELPMKIRITESKHRQITLGVFYATVDGPGVTFAWTHRNLGGMGDNISIDGDLSKRYLAGKIVYKKPDFLSLDQIYRAQAIIEREHIHAYISFTYGVGNYIERKFSLRSSLSCGLELDHINVANSASDGTYLLISLPFFGRYNTSDDLLNPTRGYTIAYQGTPFQSLEHGNQHFYKQRLTANFYIPVWTKRLVFATRFQLGSISGAKQPDVPLSLLFLGGSEDDLRGYRYKTVSPLNEQEKPYGGRSAIFLTLEGRIRFSETIGVVPFADFGTVTFNQLPQFNTKWYKSAGIGLRYFTFFGPLRFDVGFPLDRRKGVDPSFRIYASIGQTF